jgi:hypothetical protein
MNAMGSVVVMVAIFGLHQHDFHLKVLPAGGRPSVNQPASEATTDQGLT